MKLKYDFVVRPIADKTVAIPIGDAVEGFNGMITLNDTGAFIFNLLKQDITKQEIIEKFLDSYEATTEKAEETVNKFLENLIKAGLLI